MKELTITNETGRLDKVLADAFPEFTRSQIKKLLTAQKVMVNQQQTKARYAVKPGDVITLEEPEVIEIKMEPEDMPLDIVYEDDDVLVVNKPQGMVVHPAPGHPNHTLVNGLLAHTTLAQFNEDMRPGIVHRIDKDTSGLLMVAKSPRAYYALTEQLREKTNVREYVALVHGRMKYDQGTINAPIGRNPKERKEQAVVANGRPAVTHYEVLKRYRNYTLVKCILETGRTHQIRVHLKYIGHPLVGDPLYGPRKTIAGAGQFLHAGKLGFKHPGTDEELIFEKEMPEIFQRTLQRLDKEDAIQ
ncbi:RluA family pseudouridine synthase [Ligilactobacillus ceti]|uniref:Pseudouridine synthase n=1 Tax=Ligilactobacillus ceti DSM 22408 TaxID=1122146 RepID=A0A0R2KPI1_9LACO|nr:RluA family pseudouridine synthase [Ligilactobacillus ceti]KRN88844.1 ribosomal large subunit pseudouridine synthase D [Ligilactobacillus ceti DSM 22408]